MDCPTPRLDFAVIAHQDSWQQVGKFINSIRTPEEGELSVEKIKGIFSFIPPRDLFRVKVRSKTGKEIHGIYIETFIDPDKLDASFIRTNIKKVIRAVSLAQKKQVGVVALGGFTSIVLEGNLDSFAGGETKFTTGNTLTTAYIVKGVEKAADNLGLKPETMNVLVIGATGDIGTACVHYLKRKVKNLLLCARNVHRLEKMAGNLKAEGIPVQSSVLLPDLLPTADAIICVASSKELNLKNVKKQVLICDAGYPKNLEAGIEEHQGNHLFHGGMGLVSEGFIFTPDYSANIYQYPAPNIIHGCMLEAIVLAFENRYENFSAGKGNITLESMEEIYQLGKKHGIDLAPFYNLKGLW